MLKYSWADVRKIARNEGPELGQLIQHLGKARCKRALRAWSGSIPIFTSWRQCPLAWAYGKPGELEAIIVHDLKGDFDVRAEYAAAARALRLPLDDVQLAAMLFDWGGSVRETFKRALEGA